MDPGKVAIVIVNHNAGEHLGRCLRALDQQTRLPNRILLIDNASTDGSVDAAGPRHRPVEVTRLDHNSGFAAAGNLGIQQADDCDWVALLHPDAFAEPDWLDQLMQAVQQHPECSFFGSRMICQDQKEHLDGAGDVYHVSGLAWRRNHGKIAAAAGPDDPEIFSPNAAAALYRRSALLAAGGFDERFFCYFEDVDLGFRLRFLGHQGRYIPRAVVAHGGRETSSPSSDFSVYHRHRNLVWSYVKNMPASLFWRFLPQHLLMNLLTIFWFSIRGQGAPILQAKWDALRGLPAVLRQRWALQGRRRVSPDQLLRSMATDWLEPYSRRW